MSFDYKNGFKFGINEKVFVSSLGRQCTIVAQRCSWSVDYPEVITKYEVMHFEENQSYDEHNVSDYLGERPVYTEILESEVYGVVDRGINPWKLGEVDLNAKFIELPASAFNTDEVAKELIAAFNSHFVNGWNTPIVTAKGSDLAKIAKDCGVCQHSWKSYTGFTSTYDYCEKCDAKKDT